MNKTILLSCIGLSVLILVVTYSLRGSSETTSKNQSAVVPERMATTTPPRRDAVATPRRTPAPTSEQNPVETTEESTGDVRDFIAAVQRAAPFAEHRAKVNERITELRKESLEESFIRLQDDQSYIPESLLSGTMNPKMDLQRMFSNRGFLKVFQEFKNLPREQAIAKLNKINEWATEGFENMMKATLYEDAVLLKPISEDFRVPLLVPSSSEDAETAAGYLVYTSMLCAAYFGENTLIINQLDEIQRIVDECIERVHRSDTIPLDLKDSVSQAIVALEENALLSILIYAAERTEVDLSEAGIPFEVFTQEVIPLFPWDAEWTPYDYPVFRMGVQLDSNDTDELFTVYSFPRHGSAEKKFFNYQERKAIIDALKDVLSR